MNRGVLLVIAITAAALSVGARAQRTEWTVPLDGPAFSPTLYPDEKSAAVRGGGGGEQRRADRWQGAGRVVGEGGGVVCDAGDGGRS